MLTNYSLVVKVSPCDVYIREEIRRLHWEHQVSDDFRLYVIIYWSRLNTNDAHVGCEDIPDGSTNCILSGYNIYKHRYRRFVVVDNAYIPSNTQMMSLTDARDYNQPPSIFPRHRIIAYSMFERSPKPEFNWNIGSRPYCGLRLDHTRDRKKKIKMADSRQRKLT